MRHDGQRWVPVGDPLPAFAHAPPSPELALAPWVLPADPAPRSGDVVVVAEISHQLLAPCPPDDVAVTRLVEQTLLFHPPEAAAVWLAGVEVWLGRRLEPGRAWPLPPAAPRP